MENTDQNNAVNDELKSIQIMVDAVKRDGEVSLRYMKSFEHDQLMYELSLIHIFIVWYHIRHYVTDEIDK